ncbi:MAG: histidine kinase [Clostridiales bacterium]|nr:histidine kinase [Clostridiales bacterium]
MRRRRKPSVIGIIFAILLLSLAFMVIASELTITTASKELRTRALEDCRAEIGYISDALYSQLTNIQLQNIDILNNESVLALAMRSTILDKYETVSHENAVMKLIRSKLSQLNLITSAQLYISSINTLITPQKAAVATAQDWSAILGIVTRFPNGVYYTDESVGFWSASPLIHDPAMIKASRIMLMSVQRNSLKNLLQKYASHPNGYQLLLSFGGHVLVNSHDIQWDESTISESTDDVVTVTRGKSQFYMIREKHAFSDLSIVAVLPVDNVMSNMVRLQKMLKTLEIICILIVIAATIAFFHIVCRPLKGISTKMQQVGEGNLSVRMAPEKTAELDEVGNTFNSMAERLQRLIDREYTARLLAVNAEKKALQYQISPHFLYNTYFQLRNLILLEENEQASRLADLMGRYLRYIVHQDGASITLGEEMDHARNYADIQSMRFGGRIDVRYDIEEGDWRRLIVPRLLVQPLIENTFAHGLKNVEKDGVIRIALKQTEHAVAISVEDNGENLSDELQENLSRSVTGGQGEEGDGVALANIHRRLQLHFGSQSRLEFGRSELGGLKVTIRIVQGKEDG